MAATERWMDIQRTVKHKNPRGAAKWLLQGYLPRYVPWVTEVAGKRKENTACNIFFTDIVQQLDLDGPWHWADKNGNPVVWGNHQGGHELSANGIIDWFEEHGLLFGWIKVDAAEARELAAAGKLVAVVWHSGLAKSGHIAVLLEDGTIAQAGTGMPFVGRPVSAGFGNLPVEYWAQVEKER